MRALLFIAALAAAAPLPSPAHAQQQQQPPPQQPPQQRPQQPPDRWKVEGEVGASVFFGNTRQTAFTSRFSLGTLTAAREFSADAIFTYGESATEAGTVEVSKRSWRAGVDLDPDPQARVSPFLSARSEGSFEKRIDLRWNLGAGGKVRLIDPRPRSASRLELSIALLAERTFPSERATFETDDDLGARWSGMLRARHDISQGRVIMQTETNYQPGFDRFSDYTINSTSSLAFALTEVVSIKLTFVDYYDSKALGRGARRNNDGQVFFSVLSAF
jgi:hypothetical protein